MNNKILLESLQGWWENPFANKDAGMYYVKGEHVYIKNELVGELLKVGPGRKLTFGKYSGVVKTGGREISWDSGKIVWTLVGELPDMFDPETKRGRYKYTAVLGKGANGVVCEAIDLQAATASRRVAVKVLRGIDITNHKELYKSALRLHCEFLWSHMLIHNTKHEHYNARQACFFLRYFEDGTGFPAASGANTLHAEGLQRLERSVVVARLPYIVMELATGDLAWKALFEKEDAAASYTMSHRREIIWQLASALEYLGKFNLLHRDLHFHNIFLSRRKGQPAVSIGDLGMMSHRDQAVLFVPYNEEGWKMRDWVPWEAWHLHCSRSSRARSPSARSHSPYFREQHANGNWQAFDVFSLGVIHLYLCIGQKETRNILDRMLKDLGPPSLNVEGSQPLILDTDIAIRMVSKDPDERPVPGEILRSLPRMGPVWSIITWPFRSCGSRASTPRNRSRSPRGCKG